jgi:RNase H-like domain found in reverse transcriptase
MSEPILVQPNPKRLYQLETDASGYTTGGTLSQEGEDGKWHPITFHSKSMDVTQHNYPIHNCELLSVIRCLEEWHHLLEGTHHKVEVYNDHFKLQYFITSQNLSHHQARWSLFLSCFNFTMIHCAGHLSGKPDALPHCSDHDQGKSANISQVMITVRATLR